MIKYLIVLIILNYANLYNIYKQAELTKNSELDSSIVNKRVAMVYIGHATTYSFA